MKGGGRGGSLHPTPALLSLSPVGSLVVETVPAALKTPFSLFLLPFRATSTSRQQLRVEEGRKERGGGKGEALIPTGGRTLVKAGGG